MLAGETILRPTRHYTIHYRAGRTLDVDAEAMWPAGAALEFTVTVAVIGIPRLVAASACSPVRLSGLSGRTGRCGG